MEVEIPLDVVVLVHPNRLLPIVLLWILDVRFDEVHLDNNKKEMHTHIHRFIHCTELSVCSV